VYGNTIREGVTAYKPDGLGGFLARMALSSNAGDLEFQSAATASIGFLATAAAGGGGSAITIQTEGYSGDTFNDLTLQSPNAGGVMSWNGTNIFANGFNTPTQTWTPAWTCVSGGNPSLGNGTATGQYVQLGKFVFFNIEVQSGSTTTFGGGVYLFSTPVTAADSGSGQFTGDVRNTGSAHFPCIGYLNTTSTIALIRATNETLVSNAAPGSYTAGTAFFRITGTFIAA